jgi:hypothetical protein
LPIKHKPAKETRKSASFTVGDSGEEETNGEKAKSKQEKRLLLIYIQFSTNWFMGTQRMRRPSCMKQAKQLKF